MKDIVDLLSRHLTRRQVRVLIDQMVVENIHRADMSRVYEPKIALIKKI